MNQSQSSNAAVALATDRTSPSAARRLAWGALILVLVGIVAYALMHEARKGATPAGDMRGQAAPAGPVDGGHGSIHEMGQTARPPMSADEERYAHALWKVHDQVRSSAVKMTFAGLAYKMGDTDKAAMRAKVQPLMAVFADARAQAEALKVPASLAALHQDYLKAVRSYQDAAKMMTGGGKGDDHLIEAHRHSEQASTLLLKVGDALWPGEYKPN